MSTMMKIVPPLPHCALRAIQTVGIRLVVWIQVVAKIQGVIGKDREILRRAALRAPVSIWRHRDRRQNLMVDEDCEAVVTFGNRFRIRAAGKDLFHVLIYRDLATETATRAWVTPGYVVVDIGSRIAQCAVLSSRLAGGKRA